MTEWSIEKHGEFNRKLYVNMISIAHVEKPWEIFQIIEEYKKFGNYGGHGQIMFSKGRSFDLVSVAAKTPDMAKKITKDFIFYSELYDMECDIDTEERDLITDRLNNVFERKGYL